VREAQAEESLASETLLGPHGAVEGGGDKVLPVSLSSPAAVGE
jgi:hypothetical protein